MRLNAYYNDSTNKNDFRASDTVIYSCTNSNCAAVVPYNTCTDYKAVYINNDPLVPIIHQPTHSVGFSVDFFCENWTGGIGFGGIDFYNNVGYLSSFNVSFLTFE